MPQATKKQKAKGGWKDFIRGALAGFVFGAGLFLVVRPDITETLRFILRLLTPAGMAGFFAVLIGDWLRKRMRSSALKYLIFVLLGCIFGAFVKLLLSRSPNIQLTGVGLYFSIWAGGVAGFAVRLALDEIVNETLENIRKRNENEEPE